ncbi:MAG: bifunctional phosphoribosylaminoimidazolecarboxamide formyltransferase/IMP cyclohydrolase [bacterium]|nr:bifunctional phosphoribosylaminoimidazolecarboxamide formyltransferase/IMP cyclohydrolase [bacterium]
MIKRALLSVSDKTGLADFARGLVATGTELVSTGGTAAFLRGEGLPVTPVSDLTGFPEILGGRVKTLHPRIHAGILARRDLPADREQLARHDIGGIDLVAVNLYPFRQVVSRPEVALETAIENIDIGGPTLLRAAAKNHRHVLVIVDPADYPEVLAAGHEISPALRYRLAIKAFRHTAVYDAGIAEWLARREGWPPAEFPRELPLGLELRATLRYGENPHQRAALYAEPFVPPGALIGAERLAGKELSYNNLGDAQVAWDLVRDFPETAAVAVKHATPCGAATGATCGEAYRKAHDADPVSIFGGVVAFNRDLDAATAGELTRIFLEVVVAPGYDQEALAVLTRRPDLRVLAVGLAPAVPRLELRPVSGGLLVQEADLAAVTPASWRTVTARGPSDRELADLVFAWRVVRAVRSNAIVLARDGVTAGIGGGQTSRIGAARIAIAAAGERSRGSVLASDAFFPFPDVVEAAAAAGVTAIVHPGGSLRDGESIAAADRLGLAMLFTGTRHFRH